MISFMNIIWLQSAPTAFVKIGWKFYLCFIIPGSIGGVCIWFFWPNTNGLPLEEVAAIFGDVDEVAILRGNIEIEGPGRARKSGESPIEEKEHVEGGSVV